MDQPKQEVTDGQPRDKDWWLNEDGNRRLLKLEVDNVLEDQYMKGEYEATFNSTDLNLTDASDDKDTSFPIKLNPQFDLAAKLMVKS